MSTTTILLSVATLWALAAVSPGPNFLLTARIAITRSRRDGIEAVAGIALGTAAWGAAGCFGVKALFLAAPWLYLTLKLLGAGYLIYLGTRLIWLSWRADTDEPLAVNVGPRRSAFLLGFATTIANPRSAISVASIFAATVPSHPSLTLTVLVMATMVVVSVGWYCLVALMLSTRRLAALYQRGRRWLDRVSGACFIAFGAKTAAEH